MLLYNLELEKAKTVRMNELAEFGHTGQTRNDRKTPYITHPRAVEKIAIHLFETYKDSVNRDCIDCGFNLVLEPVSFNRFNIDNDIVREHIRQVALGHDLIEDSKGIHRVDTDTLIAEYIHPYVINGIQAMTKHPVKGTESYFEYLRRVYNNPYSRIVKLADLNHNSSDLKPGNMLDKYTLATQLIGYEPIKLRDVPINA